MNLPPRINAMKYHFGNNVSTKFSLIAILALGACVPSEPSKSAKLFKKKCSTCHSMIPGKHKVGPSLAGVIGRRAGSTDFTKYKALKGADFIWDEEKISAWIANPKRYIGKPTAMTVKVKKEADRKTIIKFLANPDLNK